MKIAVCALACASVLCLVPAAHAGDLTPPPGPVVPTMKTLVEVEPRIALSQENTPGDATARFIITDPGSYYLTGNVTTSFDESCIRVLVGGVTIDLNGFSIEWDGDGASTFGVDASGQTSVTVRNGNIASFTNGVVCGRFATVENVAVAGCEEAGIFVEVASHVRGCKAISCGTNGIEVGTSCRVSDCVVNNSGGVGIAGVDDCVVTGCQSSFSGADGFRFTDECVFEGCTAKRNTERGFALGAGCRLGGCVASGNTLTGVSAEENTSVSGCTVSGNGQNGLVVGESGAIDDTVSSDNSGTGLVVGAGSVVTSCAFRDNTSDGISGSIDCGVTGCVSSGNGDDGISLSGNANIIGCATPNNGGSGITITSGRIGRCSSIGNADHGIFAVLMVLIEECHCSFNGGRGISGSAKCTVRGCDVTENIGGGILVNNQSDVIGNTVGGFATSTGDGAGIFVIGSDCVVDGNTVTHCDTGISVTSVENTIVRNIARDNDTNYLFAPGNDVGTIQASPVGAGAWDNFDF